MVIGGSHGKTTITAMVLHALKHHHKNSITWLARLLKDLKQVCNCRRAPVAIFEGDEYLASTLDRRPKFLLYKPQIALISGVAWDHVNVFPTYRSYVEQFENFVKQLPADGALVYCDADLEVRKLAALAPPRE